MFFWVSHSSRNALQFSFSQHCSPSCPQGEQTSPAEQIELEKGPPHALKNGPESFAASPSGPSAVVGPGTYEYGPSYASSSVQQRRPVKPQVMAQTLLALHLPSKHVLSGQHEAPGKPQ